MANAFITGNRNNSNTQLFEDIAEFHERFGLKYDGPPTDLRHMRKGAQLQAFRRKFITEEFIEFIRAEAKEDAKEELDACVDMVYVILGYCYLRGWNFAAAWDRVHEANMTKERVPEGDPRARSPWDVVKPPGFVPPDHSDLVRIPDATALLDAYYQSKQ